MTKARPRAIAFAGFMGAGKSEAARAAAEALGETALDADTEIEVRSGASISKIFARDGEAAFRALEEEVTLELLDRGGIIAHKARAGPWPSNATSSTTASRPGYRSTMRSRA